MVGSKVLVVCALMNSSHPLFQYASIQYPRLDQPFSHEPLALLAPLTAAKHSSNGTATAQKGPRATSTASIRRIDPFFD